MKKVLLLGLILAILILAMPQGVLAATGTGSATVSASIEDYTTLSVVQPSLWTMSFANNPIQCDSVATCNLKDNAISGTVYSSDDWTLTAHADAPYQMGASSTGPYLTNLLYIQTESGWGDLNVPGTIAHGAGNLAVGEPFANDLKQTLADADRSDLGYSIVIALTATSAGV